MSEANQQIHQLRDENAYLKSENAMLKKQLVEETKMRYNLYKKLSQLTSQQ